MEDELARGSSGDIPTVIISYAVMFLYISLALGESSLVWSSLALDSMGILLSAASLLLFVLLHSVVAVPLLFSSLPSSPPPRSLNVVARLPRARAGQIKFDRLLFVRTKFMLGLAAILVSQLVLSDILLLAGC